MEYERRPDCASCGSGVCQSDGQSGGAAVRKMFGNEA